MTGATALLRRTYELHGVGLEVRTEEPAVIEAMELRLQAFRVGDAGTHGEPVRFDFFVGRGEHSHRPEGAGRPVYDTPYGSLHYDSKADALWGEVGGVELRCDAARGVATFSSAEFVGRGLYMATHPLATISLIELLERRGLFSLHAACLAEEDGRGVLLAGPSGAGKSTLALALARSGMGFLSDDIIFLALDPDTADVRVRGFSDAIGVTAHVAEHFAELRALLGEPPVDGFPKRLARIEELLGAPACTSCEPHALVFPEVAPDQPSRIAPLDGGDALVRLVPDVLVTEPVATQAHLEAIAALLRRVRCYALRSGEDLERAAELVRALI